MNGLGKPFRKKPIQKIQKTVKISEIAACEQKTTTEKPNFCSNTVFSLNFKIRVKNSRHKTTRFFAPFPVSAWPKSLLQFDFKNHENVWTDLKKKTAPQYNSNSLNCKKPRAPQYSYAQLTASQLLKNIYKSETIKSQYLIVKNHDETKTVNSIAAPDCSTS